MTAYASRMTGIGSAFPKHRMTNHELKEKLAKVGQETSHEWISDRTGIQERRISKPGDESEFNSSLGAIAATKALEMAGKNPEDIELIIYATCSPDTLIPSTACWLQKKIGAKNAAAFDINAACSGFVYGVSIADQYIRSGTHKNILVIGGEVLSSIVNWNDRTSCILFGDGVGAAVLEQTEPTNPRRILSTHLLSDGNLWELFYTVAGGSAYPLTHEALDEDLHKMKMKGPEIFKVAVKTLADFAKLPLEKNGISMDELDWFIPHQANLRIIEACAKRLKFPMEKIIVNVDRYGNTSAATVPTAMDEAVRDGRIQPGHLVLMDVFGAGLTYGSVLMRW